MSIVSRENRKYFYFEQDKIMFMDIVILDADELESKYRSFDIESSELCLLFPTEGKVTYKLQLLVFNSIKDYNGISDYIKIFKRDL